MSSMNCFRISKFLAPAKAAPSRWRECRPARRQNYAQHATDQMGRRSSPRSLRFLILAAAMSTAAPASECPIRQLRRHIALGQDFGSRDKIFNIRAEIGAGELAFGMAQSGEVKP